MALPHIPYTNPAWMHFSRRIALRAEEPQPQPAPIARPQPAAPAPVPPQAQPVAAPSPSAPPAPPVVSPPEPSPQNLPVAPEPAVSPVPAPSQPAAPQATSEPEPTVVTPAALPLASPPNAPPREEVPNYSDPQAVHDAALRLRDYLLTPGANFGTRHNPSPTVLSFQRLAGLSTADGGIVGPEVRFAARAVGVELPLREAAPYSAPVVSPVVSAVASEPGPVEVAPTVSEPTPRPVPGAPNPIAANQPFYDALAQISSLRPDYMLPGYFSTHPLGMNAMIGLESNQRWTAIGREAPRRGATTPRFSYGGFQILDDSAAGLYGRRHVLGPYAHLINPIPTAPSASTEPDPALVKSLTQGSSRYWWPVLAIITAEDNLKRYFDLPAFIQTGVLRPKSSLADSQNRTDATTVSDWVNKKSILHPNLDPVATLYQLYNLASSLRGMAKMAGTDKAEQRFMRYMAHYADNAKAVTT